jgi:FkbM family methyltransferase
MSWKAQVTRVGSRVAPRTWLSLEIARRNRHFEKEYWLLPQLVRRDANAVDIGGNTGLYAYYLSRLVKVVHVFEPNPICLGQLARVRRKNWVVHDIALSDHCGEATMRFDPGNEGVGTIEPKNRLNDNPGIKAVVGRTVKVCPLDDLNLDNIAFMKIDVEGHEPSVLRGATRLIATQKPVLLIEIERRHNTTAFEEVEDLLAGRGYSSWRLAGESLVPVRRDEVDGLQARPPRDDRPYINNFIFIPQERAGILEKLRERESQRS